MRMEIMHRNCNNDDIFVGYRYYDTFGKDVAYEFGYGGSYTKFAMSTQSVTADKDKVTVKVKVKNTGSVSGKEVAEVYFSAPEGNLGQTVSGAGRICKDRRAGHLENLRY